ncbi:MAG: hypothetical protein NZ518_03050, partial [Dehalococcoidia bacterium]|nr:hypothetical protein [Dehalococcoidia bacterium]
MASSSEPEVKPPRRDTLRGGPSAPVNAPHPDLEWKEIMQGQRPADLRVRIATHKSFRRVGRDVYLPREGATEPKGGLARL